MMSLHEVKQMRKTLRDVAEYLKEIMVPVTQEDYEIDPAYTNAFAEEDIRKGVLAFRGFLVQLFDALYAKGDAYDTGKKVPHEFENRISLSVYYPFLHNVSTMLMNMGYHGIPDKDAQFLASGNALFNKKLSVAKNLECLRFLADCGICIDGIDLHDKKQNLPGTRTVKISYPDDPAMLTGLKVMAIAETDHGTLVNQDVFLRCDYRVLKKDEPDVFSIVKDTVRPLSPEVQAFVLELHERYTGMGLDCAVEVKGFHIYIKYRYRRKDLWGINASLNNGYHINVKPKKTQEYTGIIKTFAPVLQDLIAKGYGCGRKREIGRCDGGCRGLRIPLDDSILDLRDDIITWFDREVSCLQNR